MDVTGLRTGTREAALGHCSGSLQGGPRAGVQGVVSESNPPT